MMNLRVDRLDDGADAAHAVVAVNTKDGREELTIDPQAVRADAIAVGWPLGVEGNFRLVQLPRQTARGAWRVWVGKDDLSEVDRTEAFAVRRG